LDIHSSRIGDPQTLIKLSQPRFNKLWKLFPLSWLSGRDARIAAVEQQQQSAQQI
jgi:hypothetical protein